MRGQRAPPLNENGDGEVDENFWAQAAADQAAGLATSGDEGGVPPPPCRLADVSLTPDASRRWKFDPV
jgi:hypothetical protein